MIFCYGNLQISSLPLLLITPFPFFIVRGLFLARISSVKINKEKQSKKENSFVMIVIKHINSFLQKLIDSQSISLAVYTNFCKMTEKSNFKTTLFSIQFDLEIESALSENTDNINNIKGYISILPHS